MISAQTQTKPKNKVDGVVTNIQNEFKVPLPAKALTLLIVMYLIFQNVLVNASFISKTVFGYYGAREHNLDYSFLTKFDRIPWKVSTVSVLLQ